MTTVLPTTKELHKEFKDEFGDMLLHGTDSLSTYIPLRINTSTGINVAIRPFVTRISDNAVLYSVKLRVGYTLNKNKKIMKASAININEKAASERLKNFCKGFAWMNLNAQRFSTMIGVVLAATQYDGAKTLERMEEKGMAAEFIDQLERRYKQYNNAGFTTNKKRAIQALDAAWILHSRQIFSSMPDETTLPKDLVGLHSGVLNEAQENYSGNVVSFMDKVAKLAEEAKINQTKDSEGTE